MREKERERDGGLKATHVRTRPNMDQGLWIPEHMPRNGFSRGQNCINFLESSCALPDKKKCSETVLNAAPSPLVDVVCVGVERDSAQDYTPGGPLRSLPLSSSSPPSSS